MAALDREREMARKRGERACRAWPILFMEREGGLVRVLVVGSNASARRIVVSEACGRRVGRAMDEPSSKKNRTLSPLVRK